MYKLETLSLQLKKDLYYVQQNPVRIGLVETPDFLKDIFSEPSVAVKFCLHYQGKKCAKSCEDIHTQAQIQSDLYAQQQKQNDNHCFLQSTIAYKDILIDGIYCCAFFMEYIPQGDLTNFVIENKEMFYDIQTFKSLYLNISKAIQSLHLQGVTHNDIKLDNFLIKNNDCKLVDFEFAQNQIRTVQEQINIFSNLREEQRSPELNQIIMNKYSLNQAEKKKQGLDLVYNDIYNLGIMMFQTYLRVPFHVIYSKQKMLEQFIQGNYEFLNNPKLKQIMDPFKQNCKNHEQSQQLLQLISKILNPNPKIRPSLQQIILFLSD